MQKQPRRITLHIGEATFNVLDTTLSSQENYFSALIQGEHTEFWVDRDPLCFPVVLHALRGYTLKRSMVESIYYSSELSREDFHLMLYEDAQFYAIPSLVREVEVLLYELCPSLIQDIPKVEKHFENDPKFVADKEEVFKNITELIECCIDYLMESDDKKMRQKMDAYTKLTVNSPLKVLRDAQRDLQEYWEFTKFADYAGAIIIQGAGFILRSLEQIYDIKLFEFVHTLRELLYKNQDVLWELFRLNSKKQKSAITDFIIRIACSFAIFWSVNRKNNNTPVTPPNMDEAFDNIPADE